MYTPQIENFIMKNFFWKDVCSYHVTSWQWKKDASPAKRRKSSQIWTVTMEESRKCVLTSIFQQNLSHITKEIRRMCAHTSFFHCQNESTWTYVFFPLLKWRRDKGRKPYVGTYVFFPWWAPLALKWQIAVSDTYVFFPWSFRLIWLDFTT